MKAAALLFAVAACGGGKATSPVTPTPGTPMAIKPGAVSSACRTAYAEYEVEWRAARTDELAEFTAGDNDVLEEILFYELATLPSRVEVDKLREIYAVVEAFLWNAPWPRALAATETAIGHCGEKMPRPPA